MILHNINLVIFSISISLKIVKKLYNNLMSKLKLSLSFLNISQIITTFLMPEPSRYTKQNILNIHISLNLKRKDHTPSKTSYNKS